MPVFKQRSEGIGLDFRKRFDRLLLRPPARHRSISFPNRKILFDFVQGNQEYDDTSYGELLCIAGRSRLRPFMDVAMVPDSGLMPPTSRATVFIVDDDPDLRTALSRIVRSAGYLDEAYPSAGEFLDHYDPTKTG